MKASGKRNKGESGRKAKGDERGEKRKRQIREMEVHPKSWREYQFFTLKQLWIINK